MPSLECVSILGSLVALFGALQYAEAQTKTSVPCDQATLTRPDVGVAYKGNISIEDYKLTARIPNGFTGWGGVANDAPFHGFVVFLDPGMHSCILFEIHLRVAEEDKPVRPHAAKPLLLGHARAWQTTENSGARDLINVQTHFSSRHDGETDDGSIQLISEPKDFQRTKSIYDTFVKSIALGTRIPNRGARH